jgi:hypothetical protein
MKSFPRMLSHHLNHFLVCSGCDKIISLYAQHSCTVKTDKIFPLAEHTKKFVRRMFSVRWNCFLVWSVCDKIVSAFAQHVHAIIFKNYSKTLIKMQISTIKNPNFEKPFRNPCNRTQVNILKQKFLEISPKKFGSALLSHRENVWTSKFWWKSKAKKRIFFRKFTKGI